MQTLKKEFEIIKASHKVTQHLRDERDFLRVLLRLSLCDDRVSFDDEMYLQKLARRYPEFAKMYGVKTSKRL